MEKLDPKKDGATPDIVEQNIEKMKELFPEAFTEGKVDLEILGETLGEYADDRPERYSFSWNGKSRARRIAQTPSTGTLRPCLEESVNWDTTQNLFIEGDNLEVLKLLQKSYHKKVKMIYIDPPYNTGNEFIYPDKFADNLSTYLQYTGQTNEEGLKISANTETSGRYHTNWLNMMLPRLKLARNLLKQDGVLFTSIDDNEVTNLRNLCDEVFGEENFIAQIVWEGAGKNDARQIGISHEYVIVYARNRSEVSRNWVIEKEGVEPVLKEVARLQSIHKNDYKAASEELAGWFRAKKATPSFSLRRFRHIDKRGAYKEDDPTAPGGRKFDLRHPTSGDVIPLRRNRGWAFDQAEFERLVSEGRITFVTEKSIMVRRYLHETDKMTPQSVFYQPARSASERLSRLMTVNVFDFPKDEIVLQKFIEMATEASDTDCIIMDFFAGSGSTGHAVLAQNTADGGTRRYILVQLPEPSNEKSEAFKAGYKTIAEIGKERIRRIIKKIEGEQTSESIKANSELPGITEEVSELDLGFKVFKLDASNIQPWDTDFDNLEDTLLNAVENIKPDRTEPDVLYELLLKYGLDLAVPIEERQVARKAVYIIGAGALIVCLAKEIGLDVVEGIAALKEELKPEVMRVVFKDSGFKDDVVKTNAVQILRQANIEDIKSL